MLGSHENLFVPTLCGEELLRQGGAEIRRTEKTRFGLVKVERDIHFGMEELALERGYEDHAEQACESL